jgi:hypothetical protein
MLYVAIFLDAHRVTDRVNARHHFGRHGVGDPRARVVALCAVLHATLYVEDVVRRVVDARHDHALMRSTRTATDAQWVTRAGGILHLRHEPRGQRVDRDRSLRGVDA